MRVKLLKLPPAYICLFILFSALIMNNEVSYADLTVFDETIVYGIGKEGQSTQISIGTISFATNGTLFANHEHNVYKLVNGNALGVGDIRPEENSGKYIDLGSYYGIAVAPNGTLYVSVNSKYYGLIYKVVNGKVFWETYAYRRHHTVKELAFNPEGELFYTDGESIYSISRGEVFTRKSIWKEKITISSIAFAPDGTLFASVRYHYPKYDLIVKRVDDSWQLVYVRPVHFGLGIDNVAISPSGDIYFEDHDPFLGQLYKLICKSQISLANGDFYLGSVYPVVSNSTVQDYFYNGSARELELNVTGAQNTRGVLVLSVFRRFYPYGLEVQVEVNGAPIEFNTTESSVAYLVSFVYSHDNVTALKIRLTGTKLYSEQNNFTPEFFIVLIGIIFAIVVLIIVYRRKTRVHV